MLLDRSQDTIASTRIAHIPFVNRAEYQVIGYDDDFLSLVRLSRRPESLFHRRLACKLGGFKRGRLLVPSGSGSSRGSAC